MNVCQQRGLQFEIAVELILHYLRFPLVRRNVVYHKGEVARRQVDLEYVCVEDRKIKHILVEAKHSDNGIIKYALRKEEHKMEAQLPKIENLVDEVVERQRFIGADQTCMATNRQFEDQLVQEARKQEIIMIDGKLLTNYYNRARAGIVQNDQPVSSYIHSLFEALTLDNFVCAIDLRQHSMRRNHIYLV